MGLEELSKISYHDGYVSNYVREENNISFILKDGWSDFPYYYKFELKNVKVEVMNNRPELVDFVIDTFNDMNHNCVLLYSGEIGEIDGKKYVKLWIEYPNDIVNLDDRKSNRMLFAGFEVLLCDDYDDTGRLYIKFIADKIKVSEAYPLLKKYKRSEREYLDDLSKFRNVLGENEFKYFSFSLDNCLCTKVEFKNGDLYIYYKNVFESYDKYVLKFVNIMCDDDIYIDELVEAIKDFITAGISATDIRVIDYKENIFVVGILLSYDQELIVKCSNIIIE